ncbi:MAG: capsular biosynthesis protein [Pseudomonadota bacterium]
MTKTDKTFLFLQGHPSLFWRKLSVGLETAGYPTRKIHFCLADWAFWWRRGAVNYRWTFRGWKSFLTDYVKREGITDILYYADAQPYHRAARQVARKLGIRAWAVEFGYLRPDWLTLERDGMGPKSHFPKNRDVISALARANSPPDMVPRYSHTFAQEAFGEVMFNLLLAYGRPFYPFHFSDKYYWPAFDYLAWLVELARGPAHQRHASEVVPKILAGPAPFTLVAMQLQSDYQIRAASPYTHLEEYLVEILNSFAVHAPKDRQLLIKIHPLDNGIERWSGRVSRLAANLGVWERVHVVKGGDLGQLIDKATGVICANSTVGLHAIQAGVPCIALAPAIYRLPGLTHQAGLNSFWEQPEAVDREFAETFVRGLSTIQVKGSFFDRTGQHAAIATIVDRLTAT